LKKAAALDSKSSDPYDWMAEAYRKLREWPAALNAADTAIRLDHEDADGYYHRACALARLGRRADALTALKRAIELDDGYEDLLQDEEDLKALATLPEFIKLLNDNPGKYSYASSGAGQLNHLEMELLLMKTGTKMPHVPYKSSGDQATALIGGHIDAAVFGITAALPYIKGGTVRPIAVMTAERYPDMPDLPAVRELIPSFGGVFLWHGILAPAGTPKPIIDKVNKAMADYLHSPDGIAQMKTLGTEAVGSTPERLTELIKYESALWAEVIKSANLKID